MTIVGIHVFRKDLRTADNLALNELAKKVDRIVGVFILDPAQIKSTASNSNYHSRRTTQFILESLSDLQDQCSGKLNVMAGDPMTVVGSLLKDLAPSYLSFNSDFTPYSIKRDQDIIDECARYGVEAISNANDQSLCSMESLLKKDQSPYMSFDPFVKNLSLQTLSRPTTVHIIRGKWLKPKSIKTVSLDKFSTSENAGYRGGRANALIALRQNIQVEQSERIGATTTRMGAYLNQGCISIRETYHVLKKKQFLLRALLWRDFLLCIYRFHPNGNSYNAFIDDRYNKISWPHVNHNDWDQFTRHETGFLLVDAAMNELRATGFINNRARLILATFWIKYLMISPFDPVYGAQPGFSKLLMDCSASQNKLNHQWVIGDLDFAGRRFAIKGTPSITGRMIRVDNDMIKRYDPDFEYISKWIPGLNGKSKKEIKRHIKEIVPMYNWRERYGQYSGLFDAIV